MPSWSRDGRLIYFRSNRTGENQIWKVPGEGEGAGGAVAVQVTKQGGGNPFESADGKYVYYTRTQGPSTAVWKVPVDGGDETPVIESFDASSKKWTVTDKGIYFLDRGGTSSSKERWVVKVYSFEQQRTSEVAELTHPPHARGAGLTVSPDGRWILGAQIEISSDLMLVENFR